MFGDFLSQALMDRIRARALKNPARLWTAGSSAGKLERNFARTAGLNLEPRQTIAQRRAHAWPPRSTARRKLVMLVDSHCHLDFPDFAARARRRRCARPRRRRQDLRQHRHRAGRAFPACARWRSAFPMSGAASACIRMKRKRSCSTHAAILIEHAGHPKVVGIGETGLDYYYEHSPREQQIANFRAHIAAARADRPAADRAYPRRR